MAYKEPDKIFVPKYKYDEMIYVLEHTDLSESDAVKHTVFFENKEYIITSAVGTGKGIGWASLGGYRVENLITYKGTLKPMERGEHWQYVELGRRERSYQGRLIKFGGRKLVICEEYTFYETKSGEQASLF